MTLAKKATPMTSAKKVTPMTSAKKVTPMTSAKKPVEIQIPADMVEVSDSAILERQLVAERDRLAENLKAVTQARDVHEARVVIIRHELETALARAKAAEESRDTVRAHAQASLDRYRAQDLELQAKDRAIDRLNAIITSLANRPVPEEDCEYSPGHSGT